VESGVDAPSSAKRGFEIRRVYSQQELADAVELRYQVFCVEQGVPASEERDGRDQDALHLIAIEDGTVIGTCRLVFVGSTVQFSRLAVAQSSRRRGIATALLQAAELETCRGGANRLVLHAQTYARALYTAAGYLPRGREFTEAGIEHIAMERVLDGRRR
jgi:predicted GNAT family N-acyltransferase